MNPMRGVLSLVSAHLFLHVSGEVQTQLHESADSLEDAAITQETVSEAGVQEVSVSLQDVIDGRNLRQLPLKGAPVGLQDLHSHVVLETLYKVEHSLQQGKGRDVPSETENTRLN